ncbi:WD40 repeat domain-containing protein [Sulfuricurvum sp.]|uniref:WD40 repeat domain-containing protein n=1 Tax=Sulfuricurvum sp. TaxID=2025608 RepID=UPI0025F76924|nr:WD40 repeat domain-containing protein [Sulfuricurvum sp.]
MPRKICLTQFDSPIVSIQPLKYPNVALVSQDNTIYTYDLSSGESTKLFHLNIPENNTLYCAFDPHHNRLLFGSDKTYTLNLIDLKQKKVLNQFDLDQQIPTIISFSPDGLYCVCGTDQGRVLLWRCDSSTLLARLHSFPEYTSSYTKPKTNYVSALTFEGMTLSTTGYGGSIVVTDYRTQKFMKRYTPGYLKNTALLIYNHSLIIGNQEGTLIKIDQNGGVPNQRLGTTHKNIRYLLQVGPKPYIIVASDLPYVTLINGDTFKVIQERYLELDTPLSALCLIDDYLLAANQNKEFLRFDLQPFAELEALINAKEYAEAYLYCANEPLLLQSDLYRVLESIYAEHLKKAKEYLNQKLIADAKLVLEPFKAEKTKEITEVFQIYSFIDRFTALFEQKKLAAFYGHAEQYPLLQETPIYQQAEKLWAEKFTKAQKLMFLNKEKEIQEELHIFNTVSSKRPFILLLLQNSAILKNYSKAIQTKNYYLLRNLTVSFPLLRKFPSYINFIKESGEIAGAITQALNERSFEQAQLLLEELKAVVQYESEYLQLKKLYALSKNLHRALTHDHLRSAYRLIDNHPELLMLSWGEELNTLWNEKLSLAEQYAIKGDVPSIKKEFVDLFDLPSRHGRLGDILRTAYHVQLKKLLKIDSENFSSGVVAYCDLFGIDTELRNLLKKAKRKESIPDLSQSHLTSKSRDQWLSNITFLPNTIAPFNTAANV